MSAASLAPFRWSLLAPRHWPVWLGLGLLNLFALVPRRARDTLAGAIGELQYRVNAKRRGIVELNLAYCYPELSGVERRAIARAHFRAYARSMADLPVLWWDFSRSVPHRLCRVEGAEYIDMARRDGRSVILLNPHTCAVDFGGIGLTPCFEMSSMAKSQDSPVLEWLVTRTRVRYSPDLFSREEGLRPIIRQLRRGTVFYYMPDEDLGARNSVFAPFFGHSKATLTTAARLSSLTGAVVIPVYVYYLPEQRQYRVVVREPLVDFPSGDAVADGTRMNRAIEDCIALCPEAYLWNLRLFRTRPDGSRMRYPSHSRLQRRPWRKRRGKRKPGH